MPLISSPAVILQEVFDWAPVWIDELQKWLSLSFVICWMNKWKRRVSNKKSFLIILSESSGCSHLPFNFSFIIYSILERNYTQDEKESLKNPPTLSFMVHCLISYFPLPISYCISAAFLKGQTSKPKMIFFSQIYSSCLLLGYQQLYHSLVLQIPNFSVIPYSSSP